MKKIEEILKNCMISRFILRNHVKAHCRLTGCISILLAAVWLLFAVPPMAVSAAAGAQLAVEKQNVTITLQKPEEEPYAVSALRFRMYVTVHSGNMDQPTFEFAGSDAGDLVCDAKVSATEDGRYLVDVIISSKDSHDIFQNGQTVIGSLVLHPTGSQTMQATAEFAHESTAEGVQPALRYVSNVSQAVQIVPIAGVEPVTVINAGTSSQTPVTPIIPESPSTPVIPGVPVTPNTPILPTKPGTSEPDSDKPADSDTEKDPDDTAGDTGFQVKTKPKLQLSVKEGARRVYFQWNEITGADGYQIYQYQEDTGKYKRLKTILLGQSTGYSKKMEYASTYKFKLRAFQVSADGSKIKGTFSTAVSITTAPSKVKELAVKSKTGGVTLTWKQTQGVEGYQIYQCATKNGKYTRIKTIKKGTKLKYVNPGQKKGTMYYKVRAYVTGADGKRVYGTFSTVKKMKLS